METKAKLAQFVTMNSVINTFLNESLMFCGLESCKATARQTEEDRKKEKRRSTEHG